MKMFLMFLVFTISTSVLYAVSGKSAPEDCNDIKVANKSAVSGVYTIKLREGACDGIKGGSDKNGNCLVDVYCDMDRFGGGWTVFQKRFDGSVDFYRNWTEYEVGFGSLSGEFYAGNKFLYYFTGRKTYELFVELYQGAEKCSVYAKYSSFKLTNRDMYNLTVGKYNGGTAEKAHLLSQAEWLQLKMKVA